MDWLTGDFVTVGIGFNCPQIAYLESAPALRAVGCPDGA